MVSIIVMFIQTLCHRFDWELMSGPLLTSTLYYYE